MTKEDDYFEIFCQVSSAFGTAATENELLNLIVESAVKTMDAKAACLFLYDPKQESILPKAQTGLSENYFHAKPLKAAKVVRALEKEGFAVFKDATTDERLENHDLKKAEGIASILTVPVRVKGSIIGVLSLYTARQREFDPKEIAFLCALADQGGIAIRNNSLLTRLRKNAMLFLDLASSINSSLDIRVILEHLTQNVCDTLEMKGVTIRLLNEDTGNLDLVASHGLSDEFLNKGETVNTASGLRALKGETVIFSDTATDKRVKFKNEMAKEGIKAMIVTPILAKDKVIGVMRLYSSEQREFPPDVLTMVEALAHQGGLAIQNASSYLKLAEDKKSLEEDIWSHRSWF